MTRRVSPCAKCGWPTFRKVCLACSALTSALLDLVIVTQALAETVTDGVE